MWPSTLNTSVFTTSISLIKANFPLHGPFTAILNRQTCSDLCQCYILEMCSALSLCVCVSSQVLCNGPGTCVPLCITGLLLRILGIKKVGIVYVESICRVQTLSLSGRILYLVSDYFFVQWSSLRDKYPKAIFLGRIV